MTDKQRKSDIEPLLMTKITEEYFSTLLNMAKELNDYTTDLQQQEDAYKYDEKNDMALNLDTESESEDITGIVLEGSDNEQIDKIEEED